MLTLCIGFVGRRFQKNYCRIHHAIISAILEAILQKKMAAFFFFKIIRVIFENRVSCLRISFFGQYHSDSIFLRASQMVGTI